ncbi:hypothetical protein RB195_018635 [Necator americanus]|uniref:Uncharacterized protein n=1 Tax=Necator americanus TaxID=51031 RepID=A0ABR1CAN1_NECAM
MYNHCPDRTRTQEFALVTNSAVATGVAGMAGIEAETILSIRVISSVNIHFGVAAHKSPTSSSTGLEAEAGVLVNRPRCSPLIASRSGCRYSRTRVALLNANTEKRMSTQKQHGGNAGIQDQNLRLGHCFFADGGTGLSLDMLKFKDWWRLPIQQGVEMRKFEFP